MTSSSRNNRRILPIQGRVYIPLSFQQDVTTPEDAEELPPASRTDGKAQIPALTPLQ
ncbi:hypothetical protein AVEN_96854-1, partial [Araneus ventricosus]